MLEENKKIVFGEEYENQEFGLIDEDDYEIVLKAEIRETKDKSKDYLNLDFKIREEVDQNFKGRHVFEALWRDKHNPEIFDFNKLNKIILTQENPKLQFGEMDEVIQYINGLCFRIKIKTT